MNDDQLRDQLERRANRVAVPDLLPAISPRLNDASPPARVARWAPLAGLAAGAVIVLALIIAVPRVPSGTAQTSVPSASDRVASSTSSQGAFDSPTPSSEPMAAALKCGANMSLADKTGHVRGCADAGVIDRHSQEPRVSNAEGDPSTVRLWWGRSYCVTDTRISVQPLPHDGSITPKSYLVTIDETVATDCQPMPDAHAVDIQFDGPVPATEVSLVVNEPWTAPGSTLGPQSTTVACAMQPDVGIASPPQTTITDYTGLVAACEMDDAWKAHPADFSSPQISNVQGDLRLLRIAWSAQVACDSEALFTLAKAGDGYSLVGETHGYDVCRLMRVVHSVVVTMNQDVAADAVSVGDFTRVTRPNPITENPSPDPSHSTPAPLNRVVCSSDQISPQSAVTVVDHAGIVASCAAATLEDPQRPVSVGNESATALSVIWQVPNVCDSAQLELWHREASDVRYSIPHFMLAVDRSTAPDSGSCAADMAGRQVTLELSEPVDAAYIDPQVIVDGKGIDWTENSAGRFELGLSADKTSYEVGDSILVNATFLFTGAAPQLDVGSDLGHVGPFYVEQLDGPMSMGNGASLLMCHGEKITSGEVETHPFDKPLSPSDGEPADPILRAYYADPLLRLPPGTWRIDVMSRFTIGDCLSTTGERANLAASIIVQVQ